jgi:energy-coupling factor transporter ATP-binding protein EcfA2
LKADFGYQRMKYTNTTMEHKHKQTISKLKLMTSVSMKDTVGETISTLITEQSGLQTGLYCRYHKINKVASKYLRMDNIVVIAGASGSGKTTLLSLLRDDYSQVKNMVVPIDKIPTHLLEDMINHGPFVQEGNYLIKYNLNDKYYKPRVWLHFCFEVSANNENIKTLGCLIGKPYSYITGGEEISLGVYNEVTKKETDFYNYILQLYADTHTTYYFPVPDDADNILHTCKHIKDKYPDYDICVSIDHSLLTTDEKDDLVKQNKLIQSLIVCKKETKGLFILLCQLNNEPEKEERKTRPAGHQTTRKDLYMGGQIFQGAEILIALNRPENLGISLYGFSEIPTSNLMVITVLKNRYGVTGEIFFNSNFSKSSIKPLSWDGKELKYIPNKIQ